MIIVLPHSHIEAFLLSNRGNVSKVNPPKINEMPYSFMSYNGDGEFLCEGYLDAIHGETLGRLRCFLNDTKNGSAIRVFDRRNGLLIEELMCNNLF